MCALFFSHLSRCTKVPPKTGESVCVDVQKWWICVEVPTIFLQVLMIFISQLKCGMLLFKRSETITGRLGVLPHFHRLCTHCISLRGVTAETVSELICFNRLYIVLDKQVSFSHRQVSAHPLIDPTISIVHIFQLASS